MEVQSSQGASQNPQTQGYSFETKLYNELVKIFGPSGSEGFIIRREKDVKDEYGSENSAIDIEVSNSVKTKDLKKIPFKHVFIQLKWKDSPEPIKHINHYIQCCDNIIKMKNLECTNVLYIYGTKVAVSAPSADALKSLKNCENVVCPDMDISINTIVNKICTFYGKKTIKLKVKSVFKDGSGSGSETSYEDLKKSQLIELVVAKLGYSVSKATRLKHAELCTLLKNNDSEPSEGLKSSNNGSGSKSFIYSVDYKDYTKRLENEKKSKLLNPESELYAWIKKIQDFLKSKGFENQTNHKMDLHSEVLNDIQETEEDFLHRVSLLQGRKIDVKDPENYDVIGRAIALMLGDLEGYEKDAKITIAFYKDKNPIDALKLIIDNLDNL